MDLRSIKIGVLGGGVSGERKISLVSAQTACKSLERSGCNAKFIDIAVSEWEAVRETIDCANIDIAFIALHGAFGEDGGIQEILEGLSVPYTGSHPQASRLAMDKLLSKTLFLRKNIPTPRFVAWSDKQGIPMISTYPVVVKPYYSGSSLGVSIVEKEEDLKTALERAFFYQDKVLLEDYIAGRELTVGILDDKALAVVEIIPQRDY